MIFINDVNKNGRVSREMMEGFVKVLSPVAPHITEEMWTDLTGKTGITYETWPSYDPAKTVAASVTIAVQVNGKMRGKFDIAKDTDRQTLQEKALELNTVARQVEGKTIRKVIVVPNKIVNIIAG